MHRRFRNLVANVQNQGSDGESGYLGRRIEVRERCANHTKEGRHNCTQLISLRRHLKHINDIPNVVK